MIDWQRYEDELATARLVADTARAARRVRTTRLAAGLAALGVAAFGGVVVATVMHRR